MKSYILMFLFCFTLSIHVLSIVFISKCSKIVLSRNHWFHRIWPTLDDISDNRQYCKYFNLLKVFIIRYSQDFSIHKIWVRQVLLYHSHLRLQCKALMYMYTSIKFLVCFKKNIELILNVDM